MKVVSLYTDRARTPGLSFWEPSFGKLDQGVAPCAHNLCPLPGKQPPPSDGEKPLSESPRRQTLPRAALLSRMLYLLRFMFALRRSPRFDPASLAACGILNPSASPCSQKWLKAERLYGRTLSAATTLSTTAAWDKVRSRANTFGRICFSITLILPHSKIFATISRK